MRQRRIVVTGIGAITPIGCGIDFIWGRILLGDCGITCSREIDKIETKVYGKVPRGTEAHMFNPQLMLGRGMEREHSIFLQYAMVASDLALKNAKLLESQCVTYNNQYRSTIANLDRAGVAIGTGGMGSVLDVVQSSRNLDQSYKKVSPYFIPKILGNMAAGQVSIRHSLRGPSLSPATACAAGSHAIGDAYNCIRLGYADLMLAGGSESNMDPLSIAGFARVKALSTGADPKTASRPFDSQRDGFVIAEGACVLVLEELGHALDRDAAIIAEVTGYGMSADAYHSTSPHPTGDGAVRSMRVALYDAGLSPDDIGYVNAHATSTPIGDIIEVKAIDQVFRSNSDSSNSPRSDNKEGRSSPLYVSSTKGATGHLLGAAGALESAFTCLALRDGLIPPTINLHSWDLAPVSFSHVPLRGLYYASGKAVTDTFIEPDAHARTFEGAKLELSTSSGHNQMINCPDPTASPRPSLNRRGDNESGVGPTLNHALKNSFGFGGTNASLVFSKYTHK